MSYYAKFRGTLPLNEKGKSYVSNIKESDCILGNGNKIFNSLKSLWDRDVDTVNFDNDEIFIAGYENYADDFWHDFCGKIAKYVEKGAIEFIGEDDYNWGFYFENGTFYEYTPIVITPLEVGGMEKFRKLEKEFER